MSGTADIPAGKHRSTTTLNSIPTHKLHTELKARFYKRIRHMRPCYVT